MSDSERSALMKQMDDDLEEHFKKLEEKAKQNEGSTTIFLYYLYSISIYIKLLPKSLAFL